MDRGHPIVPGGRAAALLLVVAIAAFLILPDSILGLSLGSQRVGLSPASLGFAGLLAVLLVATRSRAATNAVLPLLFLLQATQLAHCRYFGAYYSAFDIELSLHESRDVWASTVDLLPLLAPPLAVSAAFFCLALIGCNALMPAVPRFSGRMQISIRCSRSSVKLRSVAIATAVGVMLRPACCWLTQ